MKKSSKAFPVVLVLVVASLVAYFLLRRGGDDKTDSKPPSGSDPGSDVKTPPRPSEVIEISLEYSTEKREWIEMSINAFQEQNPSIKVKLIAKGSLESANAILDGADKPVMWSPADSLVAN